MANHFYGTGVVIGAAGSVKAVEPQSPTDLGNIRGRLAELRAMESGLNDSINRIADKVVGSTPEADAAPRCGPAAVPNGIIAEINEVIDGLYAIAEANRRALSRLDNLA